MTLKRWATRRDTSELEIVAALVSVGAQCKRLDVFDLLVLFRGAVFLLECKTGNGPRTSSQQQMVTDGWPLRFVTTPDEALRAIGALKPLRVVVSATVHKAA